MQKNTLAMPVMTQYPPHPILADQANQVDFASLSRFRWFVRVIFVGVGIGLVSLLVIAATLKPDPRGHGTHEQLGLPPCSFAKVLNARCPSCGMTTAWSYMMRGQVFDSFRANVGGALLVIMAIFIGPWLLISGLLGKWIVNPPSDKIVVLTAITVGVVTLVDWICRIV